MAKFSFCGVNVRQPGGEWLNGAKMRWAEYDQIIPELARISLDARLAVVLSTENSPSQLVNSRLISLLRAHGKERIPNEQDKDAPTN